MFCSRGWFQDLPSQDREKGYRKTYTILYNDTISILSSYLDNFCQGCIQTFQERVRNKFFHLKIEKAHKDM